MSQSSLAANASAHNFSVRNTCSSDVVVAESSVKTDVIAERTAGAGVSVSNDLSVTGDLAVTGTLPLNNVASVYMHDSGMSGVPTTVDRGAVRICPFNDPTYFTASGGITNTATGLRAPVDGIYRYTFDVMANTSSVTTLSFALFYPNINGVVINAFDVFTGSSYFDSSFNGACTFGGVATLNANDVLGLSIWISASAGTPSITQLRMTMNRI